MRILSLKNSTFLYRRSKNKTLVVILPCYYIENVQEVKKRFKIKNKYDVIYICFNRNFDFGYLIKEIETLILKISGLYNKTIIIGYSKGGIVLNYLNLYSDKIKKICGATPYKGVWYTPKEAFYNRVKNPIIRKIYSKFIDNNFADKMIGIKGDGMIPKESQEINENVYIEGSHANGFQKIMKDLEKKGHL